MKQLKTLLLGAAIVWCIPSFAQLVIKNDARGRAITALFVPASPVVPASSKIKKATLARTPTMPASVSLDPFGQLAKIKNECPFLKAARPTLELEGERRTNETVNLEWKTTNGANNLGFDVERSFGDTLHFERVSYVWAKNIAGIRDRYQLPDGNDYNQLSYYRLRLTLRSGERLYSNIARVAGYKNAALAVYPNPASSSVRLNFTANSSGATSVQVLDGNGKLVWQQSVVVTAGANNRLIPLDNLSAGVYTVRVEYADKSSSSAKFVRQ